MWGSYNHCVPPDLDCSRYRVGADSPFTPRHPPYILPWLQKVRAYFKAIWSWFIQCTCTRLEGTYCTTHRLPGTRIPSNSWSWPCLLLPQLGIAYLKCFTEKHVQRVLVKQWGDGARTRALSLVKSAAVCTGCLLGVLSWPRHRAESGWKSLMSFTSHQKIDIVVSLQGGCFEEKREYGSHYSSLK